MFPGKNFLSNIFKTKKNYLIFTAIFILSFFFGITLNTNNKKGRIEKTPESREYQEVPQRFYDSKHKHLYIRDGSGESWSRSGLINTTVYDDPLIAIDSHNVGENATIYLYKATKYDVFNFFARDEKNNQVNPEPDLSKMELLSTFEIELDDDEDIQVNLPLEGAGLWFVKVESSELSNYSFINRSKIAVVNHEGNGKQIYWAQDLETKRTLKEGALSIYTLFNKPMEIREFSLEDGIVETPIYPEADIGILEHEGSTALIPINLTSVNFDYRYEEFTKEQSHKRFFIYTDRPLYSPGEKVYYKAILRNDKDGIYSIPSGNYTITAYTGWGEQKEEVYKENLYVDNYGTLDGEISLPEDIKTGTYSLSIENTAEDRYFSSVSFRVEYFRKPEYFVEIKSPKKTDYIQGDTFSIDIGGQYFSGQPLGGKEVNYKVYASKYYDYRYYSHYLNYINNSLSYRYGYRYGKVIDKGSLVLDNSGLGTLNVQTNLSVEKTPQIFVVEISYSDATRNDVIDTVNILVNPSEYNVFIKERYSYSNKINTRINIPLILVSHNETSVSSKNMDVHIIRKDWIKVEDDSRKWGYRYERIEEDFDSFKLQTDSNGEAEIIFTPEKKGNYEITVKGTDSRGNEFEKIFGVWVYGDERVYRDNYEDQNIVSILNHKDMYSVGEEAKFTLISELENIDYFLTLERGFVRDYKVISFEDQKVQEVSFDIDKSMVPNMYIGVSTFDVDDFYKNVSDFEINKDAVTVFMDIESNKDKYGPGDNVELKIKTEDNLGDPVSTDVSIAAVDKALFELEKPDSRNILDMFWMFRYRSTMMSHSLEDISYDASEKGGCFIEGTLVNTPKGFVKIEDIKIGQKVLTKNEVTGKIENKKVIGIQEHTVGSLIIINDDIKVTPEHYIKVNDGWKTANALIIGDELHKADGNNLKVNSIELIRGSFKVYNLSVKDNHNYFAENILVHNQKGGVTRDVFENTAYWNPSVITDENGEAVLNFTLPDNLTTWVISGIGHTLDTKVGSQTKEIVVSKDIISRPILPNILRTEENVYISTLVQNFTDNDMKLVSGMEFPNADILSQEEFTDEFAPNTTKEYFWNIYPNTVSEDAKVTFYSADVNNLEKGDRITVGIPIKKFGYPNKESHFYYEDIVNQKIDLSPTADLDESTISIDLSSTLLGSLSSSFKYLINYPYGCVEQTTSRLVPIIIMEDNPEEFSDLIVDKDTDDMIEKGFERLISLQNDDGSWSWWSSRDPNNFITSYVVEYLLMAEKLGYTPNENILDPAISFLKENEPDKNNSYNRMYRLYVLELATPEVNNDPVDDFDNMTPDTIALASMYNILNGVTDTSVNGIDLLISKVKDANRGKYWSEYTNNYMNSAESTTSLAIRAILMSGSNVEYASEAIRYLTVSKNGRYWRNTWVTANVLRSISEYSKYEQETTSQVDYEVYLDEELISSGSLSFLDDNVSLLIDPESIKEEGSTLRIEKSRDGNMYTTIFIDEFETDRYNSPNNDNKGIKITREYVNEKGPGYNIGLGDTVEVLFTVEGYDTPDAYAIIEDFLPAGLIPINEHLDNQSRGYRNYWNRYSYEYKLNGVVIPIRYPNSKEFNVSYKARVVSKGEFYAPPAVFEIMYEPEVSALSDISFVQVEDVSQKIKNIPIFSSGKGQRSIAQKEISSFGLILTIFVLIFLISIPVVIAVILIKRLKNDKKNKKDTDTNSDNS